MSGAKGMQDESNSIDEFPILVLHTYVGAGRFTERVWPYFSRLNITTLLLLLHFGVLTFNNLPYNALTDSLDDYYLWYLNGSGNYQRGWSMYSNIHTSNDRFELEITDLESNQIVSTNHLRKMRELLIAEWITGLDSETQGKLARHFLTQKRRDYSLKPNERIELKRYSIPIPLNKASPFNRKEHTHSWRLDPEKP